MICMLLLLPLLFGTVEVFKAALGVNKKTNVYFYTLIMNNQVLSNLLAVLFL